MPNSIAEALADTEDAVVLRYTANRPLWAAEIARLQDEMAEPRFYIDRPPGLLDWLPAEHVHDLTLARYNNFAKCLAQAAELHEKRVNCQIDAPPQLPPPPRSYDDSQEKKCQTEASSWFGVTRTTENTTDQPMTSWSNAVTERAPRTLSATATFSTAPPSRTTRRREQERLQNTERLRQSELRGYDTYSGWAVADDTPF